MTGARARRAASVVAAPLMAAGAVLALTAGSAAAATMSDSVPATAQPAVAARAAKPALEICGQGPAVTRPASIILTCADAGELATHLTWASWGAARATATGLVTWRTGAADLAASRRWDKARADVSLTDPVAEPGHRVLFTRLELRVTGATPKGFLRDLAFSESPMPGGPLSPALPPPARIRPAAAAASSGTLGYAEIEGYWIDAGGPTGSAGGYTDPQIAAAITGAESSFLPGIIQQGVDYCGAGSDRAGWGLWQITCGEGNFPAAYGADFQLLDPWNNAEVAVYKCMADVQGGYNCFDPWSTYTSGAYQSYLQHTAADTTIPDTGQYVQDGSTPPGTPSSPAPAPGTTYGPPMPGSANPTAVVGADGTVRVYARQAGSNLAEIHLPPGGSWSGWYDMGGSWPANQAALVDSAGVVRVYAVGSTGDLYEKHLNPGSTWSGWDNLGQPSGGLQGAPAAVQDLSGTVRVYARGQDGSLYEIHLPSGGTWSGWYDMGGSWPSDPAALVDSAGVVRVYAVGTTASLYEKHLNPGGTWSGWDDLGGSVAGVPSAVQDHSGTVRVYVRGTSGALEEFYLPSGGSWHEDSRGGSWPSDPAALVDSAGVVRVYAVGTTASLYEDHLNPGGTWSGWDDLGGSVAGVPSAVQDHSGTVRVYVRGTDLQLHEFYLPSGGSWHEDSRGGSLY